MENGQKENRSVVAGEISAGVNIKITREEITEARTYRCCICHKVKMWKSCTRYYVEVNGVRLAREFRACPEHYSRLEVIIQTLVETLTRDLVGFLAVEAEEFFGNYC